MRYVIYENNGKIKWAATGAKPELFCLNGESYLTSEANVSDKTHYVDLTCGSPILKQKPEMPVVANKTTIKADETDTVIFSNILNGTVCTHDSETYTITDGVLEFTATHDGEYNFTFTLFPYIPKTITITASEAETAK